MYIHPSKFIISSVCPINRDKKTSSTILIHSYSKIPNAIMQQQLALSSARPPTLLSPACAQNPQSVQNNDIARRISCGWVDGFLSFLNLLLQVFTYRSDARTRAGSVHSPNIRRRTEYGFCSALIAQGRLLFFLVPFPTLGTNSTTWKLKKFLDYWLNISSTERRRRYNSAPRNVTESFSGVHKYEIGKVWCLFFHVYYYLLE